MIVTQQTKYILKHWRWLGRHRGWAHAAYWVQCFIWQLRKQRGDLHKLHWSQGGTREVRS